MTNSTITNKKKILILKIFAVFFWLLIWQFISSAIGQEILLVSPAVVVSKLFQMIQTADFWKIVIFSFTKIMTGFFVALILGSVLAYLSFKSEIINVFLTPINVIIKATPIASFIILALLWINSKNLSIFISFLMVFPIMYNNILNGIKNLDYKMDQMATVFKISAKNKFIYVTLPQIMPFFISACTSSLGLCWKAGIAAEVIATPQGSIGDKLYRAKLYLDTGELFAWTAVVIILSLIFEKFFIFIVKIINQKFESI